MPNPRPPKTVRFEFYLVEMPEGEPPFVEVLEHAKNVTDITKRLRLKGGNPLRWEHLETTENGFFVGDITRIKNEVIPNKAAPGKPRERMKFEEDEGPTEDTAFGFDPKLGVMICQAAFQGISAHTVAGYFSALWAANKIVTLYPVLTLEGVEKLDSFSYFDRLVYRVARPNRGPLSLSGVTSVDSQLSIAEELGAKYCTVEMSVGRAKGKIGKDQVTAFVAGLLRLRGTGKHETLRKLELEGRTEGGHDEPFDLLKNRLVARQTVAVTDDRDMPYKLRRAALLAAFEQKRPTLEAQFSHKEKESEHG